MRISLPRFIERRSSIEVNDQRRLATYPGPYPDGWYVLARSDQLGTEPLYVEALGESFVVYRRANGEPAILDAFCPHLGANLAGGKVKGDCIECPFHRWQFGPEGRAEHIPYRTSVPRSIGTRAWPVEERYGMVCVYYSAQKLKSSPKSQPAYALPRFSAIDEGELMYSGKHDAGVVRMHLIEFAENSVDFQHFAPLHGSMLVPWTRFRIPGLEVIHDAGWEPDATEPHIAWFRNDAVLAFRGRRIRGSEAKAMIQFIGPGGIVVFTFELPSGGRIHVFQTHTPEQPLAQRVHFHWYRNRKVPRFLASYVVGNWVSQWREDIAIWESKVYNPRPMLVPGDGPVHQLRRWYRQFYPAAAEATWRETSGAVQEQPA